MTDLSTLHQQVIERLTADRPQLVRSWFRALQPVSLNSGSFAIRANNQAQFAYLESRCRDAFTVALQDITGRLVSVEFELDANGYTDRVEKPVASMLRGAALDPLLTFAHFAVGPCNRLAHAAAEAVSESGDSGYNPLLIHSPAGSGKTHLLQAIAHQATDNRRPCCYLTGELIVDRLIGAVERGEENRLRAVAADLDIVLIDNIHVLSGKQRSQEEFFHLLNRLLERERQVVLSSDRPLGEMTGFADRLVSRFSAGLVAALECPCLDTRVEILRRQATALCIDVPDEVVDVIAGEIENPRELRAALIRLDSLSRLRCFPISVELAREAVSLSQE